MKAQFISDNGKNLQATNEQGEVVCELPRYAVWGDLGKRKPEVIEVSDDLEALQAKHGPSLPVFRTPGC